MFVVDVQNRAYTRVLNIIQCEAFLGTKPFVHHLRIFGCTAFALLPKYKQHSKLGSKTQKCIFLGFVEGSKSYRLWNPVTRQIVKARDVISNEADCVGQVGVSGVEGG